jgi:AraC-like DNA-binding protein
MNKAEPIIQNTLQKLDKYICMHPILRDYVQYYVIWNRSSGYTNTQLFLPNTICGIGFILSGQMNIHDPHDSTINAPVAGLRNVYQPARRISTSGDFLNISIRFYPFGLSAFTDIPCTEIFSGHTIHLQDIFNPVHVQECYQQLLETKDISSKIRVLEQFLLLCFKGKQILKASGILQYMVQGNGNRKISEIADYAGYSERTLLRIFNKDIGITPKQYNDLLRFRNCMQNISKGDLLDMAVQHGFYDSSHLIHTFQSYTGMTPGEFIKKNNEVSDFYNF